jgi:urea transport system substrate-binding protein
MSQPEPSDLTLPGSPSANFAKVPPPRKSYPFLLPTLEQSDLGRLGDYRVLRLLGTGGMGYVFEAEEQTLRRRVALKVLRPELAQDSAHRERFLREARAAAAVSSDHVITIYQIADSEVPYLAMQFLEGESLQERIEKSPPITLREAMEIGRQTAEGLAAAHVLGFTHRDIKPANLWLERVTPPSSFRVKLLDFGLARRSTGETSLTSTGFIVGTPNFMSPEQAAGGDVDARSDLFSLGCVLYTILVGELPFPGNSAMAVMMALANRTPPPVNQQNPSIPQGVADLVARLLEKDPAMRPRSAQEVADTLASMLLTLSGSVGLPASTTTSSPTQKPFGGETIAPSGGDTLSPTPLVVRQAGLPVPQPRVAQSEAVPLSPPWISRRRFAVIGAILGVLFLLAGVISYRAFRNSVPIVNHEPIVVGILHSKTGTMAVSEGPVIDATQLAIDEINATGGVLGRQVRSVVVDGESKPEEFARLTEKLMDEDNVVAIFGCWTSASRLAVRDVLQRRNDGLLFYPVQYEGLGDSPRVVYLGPAPNQQLIPAIEFLTRSVEAGGLGKKRLYLVGSDYIFPRVAHEIVRDQVELREKDGVQVVGEWFLPLGSEQGILPVGDINRKNPDAIVSTLNGTTNVQFFRELRNAGFTPATVPTMSLSITENEVMGLNPATLAGDYIAASYFQTIDRQESRDFLRKLRQRSGQDVVATDPMAAAYSGVHLWAKSVEKAGNTDPIAVREAIRGMEFDGVRARVTIDAENLHTWLPARIGRIRSDGLVDLVAGAGSEAPIRPEPFPPTRKRAEWNQLVRSLQFKWGGGWQPPENALDKK